MKQWNKDIEKTLNKIRTQILSRDKIKIDLTLHEVGSPIWLILVHGLGEHKDRHSYLYDLIGQDFNIAMLDLRGHGKSEGTRSDVNDFYSYLDDLELMIKFLQKDFKMNDFILMGHSMGGLIVTRFLQEKSIKPIAAFLSSPALGVSGILNKVIKRSPFSFIDKLASLNKGIYLKGILDLKKLSHNYLVYKDYINDPLNSLKTNSRLLFKIIREGQKSHEKVTSINTKVYGAIGSDDALVSFEDCKQFFNNLNRTENLRIIKNGYHELHNESEEYKVHYLKFLKKTLLSYRYNGN